MKPFVATDDEEDSDDSSRSISTKTPGLVLEDSGHSNKLMQKLNILRKEGTLCDTTLEVGRQTLQCHRAVLSCTSGMLMELFTEEENVSLGHFTLPDTVDYESLRILVNYAYTSKLEVPGHKVRSVYRTAHVLKMDRAAELCSNHLAEHLSPKNCLEIRAFANSYCDNQLADKIDSFIQENIKKVIEAERMSGLTKYSFDIMGILKEDLTDGKSGQVVELVLQWLQSASKEITLKDLEEKRRVLFLTSDNVLRDAADDTLDQRTQEGLNESNLVQDYKKHCRSKKMASTKSVSSGLLGSRTLSSSPPTNSTQTPLPSTKKKNSNTWVENEWKVVASYLANDHTVVAVAMIAGNLSLLSIQYHMYLAPDEVDGIISIQAHANGNGASNGDMPSSPGVMTRSIEKQLSLVPLAKMTSPRCGLGTVAALGKLVAVGGYDRGECLNTMEAYDLSTNTWSPMPPLPCPRGRFDITQTHGRLYCCGGSDGSKDLNLVHYFELSAGEWRSAKDLLHERSSAGVASVGNKVYVIGGWSGCNGISKCEVLDLDTEEWSPIANMKARRSQVTVCRYNDKIIAVGGTDGWECLNTVECYNTLTGEWSMLPPMSTPRRGASCAVFHGKIYVVGGTNGQYSLSSVEILDVNTMTWSPGPTLNVPRANLCVSVYRDRLFAVGGYSGKKFLNSMEFLDIESEEWSIFIPSALEQDCLADQSLEVVVLDAGRYKNGCEESDSSNGCGESRGSASNGHEYMNGGDGDKVEFKECEGGC